MHRHGYKGRKFGRENDQRTALTRGLMRSLFKYTKKGDLASRRLVIARLGDQETANDLVDNIAPQIKRNSGYLKIERTGFRRGDNSEMATISFVDEIKDEVKEAPKAEKAEKKPAEKKEDK